VLAELLSLDLGSLTPIRALNLLHDLQSAARATLPWRSWLGDLTRPRSMGMDGARDPSEIERG